MRVVSVFDGMSCGRVALVKAGIEVDKYFASEIDAAAMTVANYRYPDTEQLGDIINIMGGGNLSNIDLLLGGSPCQGFSLLGKQLNLADPRSKLFFEYLRLLKELRPKYFLLENVVMSKKVANAISDAVGVDAIQIDSRLVSGQQRKRLYWTNIKAHNTKLFGNLTSKISQPKDRRIYLRDILEPNVDEEYFLKGKQLEYWEKTKEFRLKKQFCTLDAKKAGCLTARMFANWSGNHVTEGGRIRILTPLECERLQTLPDYYTAAPGITNNERYKMIGNGWNIETIVHILNHIK